VAQLSVYLRSSVQHGAQVWNNPCRLTIQVIRASLEWSSHVQIESEEAPAMKVALTGATGFIGSHVLTDLDKHGHEVMALVRSGLLTLFFAFVGLAAEH
jgi:NAD dependent epimerase/dehydratase family